MRAAVLQKPGEVAIIDIPAPPPPGPGEVRVAVKAVGLCGSDLHAYRGHSSFFRYPGIIGHEAVGEICALGPGVTGLAVGDRAAMDPVISCGRCVACRKGRNNVCSSLKVRGAHADGAMCEQVNLPGDRVHLIPDGWSWDEAALIEPFTIAAQTMYRGRIAGDDRVVILGAGPIGLVVLQAVKTVGAKVLICDVVEERLERARECGADIVVNTRKGDVVNEVLAFTDGEGADVVVEGVGLPELFDLAVEIAAPTGRIVVLGFSAAPARIAELPVTKKELEIIGSRLHTNRFPQVIDWYRRRAVDPRKLISHVFPCEEVGQALRLFAQAPEITCKIVLRL
jgi:L-gulonate 5-dehydrogenase